MIGPISAGMVSQAIAETSWSRGVPRTSKRRATGVIIDPPTPCRNRDITKAWIESEKAQATDPAMKTTMARRKMFFDPKRSAIQPLIGMKIASATRYEVTASLSAMGEVPISAAIAGSDVAMTVESICSMKSATARMRGVILVTRRVRKGGGTAAGDQAHLGRGGARGNGKSCPRSARPRCPTGHFGPRPQRLIDFIED